MMSKENQHTGSLTKLPEPAQLRSEGLGISAGQQASLHLLLLSTAGASPASASKSPAGRGVTDSRAHTQPLRRTVRTEKQRETQRLPPRPQLSFCLLLLHSSSLSDTPEDCTSIFLIYCQPAPSGTAGARVLLSSLKVTPEPPKAPSVWLIW